MKFVPHTAGGRFAVLLGTALAGCMTAIQPQDHTMRLGDVRLASYDGYVLQPLAVETAIDDIADQTAARRIEADLRGCLRSALRTLREELASAIEQPAGRLLVVQPTLVALKMVSASERRWVGPFAGSSAVLLKLEMRDAGTQDVVAAPVFHARSSAWRGSFPPFGSSDEAIVQQVVDEACAYTRAGL